MKQSLRMITNHPVSCQDRSIGHRHWIALPIAALITLALIFAPWPARANEAADAIGQIWQRVYQIGAYEFRANVTQEVVPVASIVNVGRGSERQELYIEGATDLRQQTLAMTLWSQGGSVFDRASGLELKLEADRLLARKGGSDWQEINNFTDALMPQGDFMVFLAGATDVQLADDSLPEGETGESAAPTRYTYRIDGPTFAAHLRDRVTRQMTRRGELALHSKLELPKTFTDMTGTGELWVRADGLPLRQVTHLRFPEQDGHWVSAKLDVTFRFAEQTPTIASTLGATLNQALSDSSHPLWQNLYLVTFLLIGSGLALFLIVRRRAVWVYKALAALCIASLVGAPLLQTAQAKAAHDRFETRRAHQQALLEQAQATQDTPQAETGEDEIPTGAAALELIRNDDGQDSDGDGRSDVQEALLGTDPLVADQALMLFGSQPAVLPSDTTDSDGDGLTDYEESLLGTAIDRADTDGDGISDYDEIRGFTYNGQTWYTDPLEPDTNGDGVSDTNEWNSAERLHPTWDTDNDGTPDLWDLDNDGDGVPDRVDASPFFNWTTVFSDTNPFALSLNGLTAGKPTFVEFQVRPTNPDHLWYTLNKLDWPQDSSGNIQDLNNSPDDIDLIPMLEILIPDAPSNLPLTAARVEVPIAPSPYFPSNWNANGPIQGKLVLRQEGNNIAVEANLDDAARLYIRRGTCDQPGERVGDEVVVARTGSGSTVALDPFDSARLSERASGGYIIQVGRNNDQITYGCGQIPLVPFEGDQMIDQTQLQPYGISVRSNAVGSPAKTLYVPLQLVVDDPANLTNNRNLPATPAPKGGRVAFRGLMRYTASGVWNNAHGVRLVWTVQMKTDRPCPQSAQPACTGYYDVPTVIHTYGDSWRLTGIDVREESGVDLAIAYEDPAVDNNRNDDVPLIALSKGLGDTFLAGRSDITTEEIARRFNHTSNGETSLVERWGISNTLGVATVAYPTLDQMVRDTVDRSQAILDATFSGAWASQAISPTLLYAYSWTYRALNLDAHSKLDGVSWNANGTQLTFDFKSTSAPLQTTAGVKLQPYRYDGSQWRTFEMANFWQELKRRYDPIIAASPVPDEAKGQLGAVLLYYFTLNNGVQQTIAIGGDAISFDPLSDTDISNVNTAVSTVYTIGYVPQAIVETAMTVGRSEGFIKFLKISVVDALFDQSNTFAVGAAESFARSAKNFKTALTGSAVIIVGAFVITAALVVAQLALTIVSIVGIWEFDATTNKAITIGLAVVNAVTMTYLGVVVPIRAALLTAKVAGETMTVLNLTNKLSGIKAANAMAIIGFIIQMGVVWGYFIYAVASGQASSGSALHSAVAFAIASTLVALLYLAITLIPVIGPIIVAILSIIDFLLTAICEIIDEFTGEANNPLRGVVTPGSTGCFTLAGALTEALMGLFYQSDIIFKFDPDPFFNYPLGVEADLDKGILPNALRQYFATIGIILSDEAAVIPLDKGKKWQINSVYPRAYTVEKKSGATTLTVYKDWQERFPSLSGFDTALARPNAGLVQGNILRFKATIGGHLAPSTPKANVGDAYDQWTIRRTGIAVELSTEKNDNLKATAQNLQWQPWRFTQVATMRMTTLQSLYPPFTTKSEFPLYLAGVPDQQVQTNPITLTTAGINTDYMTPVYLNVGMQLPLYSCIMAFCEQGKEFSSQSLPATTVVDSPKFTLDVLPPTLDGFYARNWGRYQYNGKTGGIAFAPPVDFDGDGLRNAAAGGLDPDDTRPDTDGDGVPDVVEMALRQLGIAKGGALMNLNSPDTDGDGLCDGDEIRLGTRADLADTDGDGLTDGEEVWHRNCGSGVWEGGWIFTYGDGRTTRVTSNPLTFDSDGDGMSDQTERRLHQLDPVLYGFHPLVKNASPVGIEQRISDRDAVVQPGDSLVYTATVYNNLTQPLYATGNLVTTFPGGFGGQTQTDPFTLFKGGRQPFVTTLTAGGGSQHVVIQSDLTAQLLASAQSVPGPVPEFVLGEGKRLTIDDDLPTSSLTSGSHVQAGGFRIIGGLAGDPTSYIQRVDVQVAGQTGWETATGAEAWAYTWDVPSSEGRYTVQSRAVDAVGHEQNPVAAAEVIVDGTPPVPTANQSSNPILPAKRDAQLRWTIALDGSVSDPASGGAPGSGVAKVEVRLEPQSSGWVEATLDGAGNWTVNYPLSGYDANNGRLPDATGQYTVQVRATDRVQNQTAAANYLTYQVRVDTTPPVATLESLGRVTTGAETVSLDQTLFITRNLVLTGTATDPGLFAAGVQGVEIAFTPAELLDTLDTPSLLLFLNEPVGVTSYANAAPGGANAECHGDRCPRNDETGIYGGAVQFDGSNDVITATLDLPEANLTVSLWFNTTNPNGGLFAATAQGTGGALGSAGADRALYLVNGNLCAHVQGVQADEICTAGVSYSDGQWHQAVLVLDDAAPFRLYVDGALGAAAGLVTSSTFAGQSGIAVGFARDRNGANRFLNGRIDEVEVYNAPLSAVAVAALYRRWQPVTLATPGATTTTWSYQIPDGLEGLYQIDLRAGDVNGNRNDELRGLWKQWRGLIDTTAPRITLNAFYSGADATAQTTYQITVEDYTLTETGYSGPCSLQPADYHYDGSPFWQQVSNGLKRLNRFTSSCTVNGFPVRGEEVRYASVSACDSAGRCTQASEDRDVLYWSTTQNATGVSALRRANLNGGYQREELLDGRPRITGLALDNGRGHLYWLERDTATTGRVRRSDLDGQNVTTIPLNPPPALSQVTFPATFDLVVNPQGGKLYWSEEAQIKWANLDGSGVATLFTLPAGPDPQPDRIGGMEVDSANGRIYFGAIDLVTNSGDALAATSDSQIWAINADGSNPTVLVDFGALENVAVIGLALAQDKTRLYWTQRQLFSDRASSGDGFFSVATGGGAPAPATSNPGRVTFISILEVSPNARTTPASHPNYAYWSVGSLIQQVDLASGAAGYFAHEPQLHLIGASATARIAGLTNNHSDLELSRQPSTEIVASGGQATYRLTVRNNGPLAAGGVAVVSTLPVNTTFVAGGSSPGCAPNPAGKVTCDLGHLPDGAERNLVIQLQVTAAAGALLTHNLTVSSNQPDPKPANNSLSFAQTLVAPPPTPAPASARYLYWGYEGTLNRTPTNGGGSELVVGYPTLANEIVQGVVVDGVNGHVYFATRPNAVTGTGYIRRINLDGTGLTTIYTDASAPWPTTLALDAASSRLYFTHGGVFNGNAIKRINLNGSGETVVVSNLVGPTGLAINPLRGELYWSDGAGKLMRAGLDGSNPQVIAADVYAFDLTVDPYTDLIYYRTRGPLAIYRILRSGGEPELVVKDGTGAHGPALDVSINKLYWIDGAVFANVRQANLDGSSAVTIGSAGARPTSQLALAFTDAPIEPTPTPTATDTPIPAATATPLPTPTAGGPPAADNLFWSNEGGEIVRAPVAGCLDGSCIQPVVTPSPGTSAGDIAIDSLRGKLYWINPVDKSIQRANLDGSSPQTLISGLADPRGITLDESGARLYWTDFSAGVIRSAALDGSAPLTVTTGLTHPLWIDFAPAQRVLYFIESNQIDDNNDDRRIRRVNLDGTGLVNIAVGWPHSAPPDFQYYISGLSVNEALGRIYWMDEESFDAGFNRLNWITLDGEDPGAILFNGGPSLMRGLAQDRNSFKLYWAEGFESEYSYGPPFAVRSSFADGGISGQPVATAIAGMAAQNDAPFSLVLHYPSVAPATCPADSGEPNDAAANATTVQVGTPLTDRNFHTGSDVDWFVVNLTGGLRYRISAQAAGSDADTLLDLYAANGTTLLVSNDDIATGQTDSQLLLDAPFSGNYLARVSNRTSAAALPCNNRYTFSVQEFESDLLNGNLGNRLLNPLPANYTPPLLDSAVLTPTDGALLGSLAATSVHGAALAVDGIATLAVTVNGANFYNIAPGGGITETIWSQAWTPPGEGSYLFNSVVSDSSNRVQTRTHPITVLVDLGPPQVTLARTVYTQTHLVGANQVNFSGSATDSNGVALVDVSVAGTAWQGATVTGTTWSYPWVIGGNRDGGLFAVAVRATDKAGRTAATSANVTIDVDGPQLPPVEATQPAAAAAAQAIQQANSSLSLTWQTATDGSGVRGYYAGFTTSPTTDLAALIFYNGAGVHTQTAGEAQRLYGHVVAVDNLGNRTVQTVGPFAADGPATPDLLGDLADTNWLATGGSQLGADREVNRGPFAKAAFGGVQKFYLSWNDQGLGMAWVGANWAGDGDLFIYLDTGVGGATQLYNPYPTPATIDLPPGMAAKYVVWVQDETTAQLLQASGGGWNVVATLGSTSFRLTGDLTHLYLPFSLLGISNASPLGVVAVASEENALHLWAAAPDKNPLNSERSINLAAVGRDLSNYRLTLHHRWPNLALGQIPNAGRFADSDLLVTMESQVNSVAVGYLESDLLDLLTPDGALDADLDGQPDAALPGNSKSKALGNGNEVQYIVRYANRGAETAKNVTLALAGFGGLGVNPLLNLGDIAPGAEGVVEVTATINGAGNAVELQARLSDEAHGVYEWFWFVHAVDTAPPTDLTIHAPTGVVGAGSQIVRGTLQDASSVPTVIVEVNGAITVCTDPTPDDGLWSCAVDFSAFPSGTTVGVRVRAVDEHGNTSPFSDPVMVVVDSTPPTVTLSAETEAALADGFINASEALLRGLVSDDQRADRVELCTAQPSGLDLCTAQQTEPRNSASGQWANLLFTDDLDGVAQTVHLTGIDGAQNRSEPLALDFRIDSVPPVVAATLEPAGIRGSVSDGGGVQIVRLRVEADGVAPYWVNAQRNGDQWALAFVNTQSGQYRLFVEAVDLAGNMSAAGPLSLVLSDVGLVYLPVIIRERTLAGEPVGDNWIHMPLISR
jgi:uncharacterized repeat protein (TIGR01451 family)